MIANYVIRFGIYCAPFLLLTVPLLSFLYKRASYAWVAAVYSLPFALWFGGGPTYRFAIAIPVLLALVAALIHTANFRLALICHVLQSVLVLIILFTSGYYAFSNILSGSP